MIYILIFMFLFHIFDDFVLQPICLSKLKCKEIWNDVNRQNNNLYKNDYKMALFIHALSWSIMIHIPLMICMIHMNQHYQISLLSSILLNSIIHAFIDNLKANKRKISLVIDQTIHFIQIMLTYLIFYLILTI